MANRWLQWDIRDVLFQLWEVKFRSCGKKKAEYMENKQTLLAYQRTEVTGLTVAAKPEEAWKNRALLCKHWPSHWSPAHRHSYYLMYHMDISGPSCECGAGDWMLGPGIQTLYYWAITPVSHVRISSKKSGKRKQSKKRKRPMRTTHNTESGNIRELKISIIGMLMAPAEKVGSIQKQVGNSKWWEDSKGNARNRKRNRNRDYLWWARQ